MARLRFGNGTTPGVAFGDYIHTEKLPKNRGDGSKKSYATRDLFLPLILSIAVFLLLTRVFFLQIGQGKYYRSLSDNNRIRTIVIHAPRGIIFDRFGNPLVFNVPGFREVVGGKTKLIGKDEAISLIAKGVKDLEIDSLRSYPYKDAFSHVLGYIGQISKQELSLPQFASHRGGDLIGEMGIEQMYENKLKGIDGKKLVEVDSKGNIIRNLGQTEVTSGENISLTLDLSLQRQVFEAMKGVKKGAAIVSTPDGKILAIVSKPSFDPNLFTLGESYSVVSDSPYISVSQILLDEEYQPLINRAISGVYPPGSTFKLVVAAAGLEDKIIDENFTVEDTGILRVGNFSFSNWYFTQYGQTDGLVNVVKGIKRSNDFFFYKLAEKVGVDQISKMAQKFGLGERLGIDIFGEVKGTVPTPAWKEKVIGEQWFLGDTYHYGIGQGYVLTTPLQVNTLTQAIANGGVLYKPHILKSQKLEVRGQKFLSDETVSLIREGMIESCSTGGVAWPLFEFKIKNEKLKIACKTGTAQHGGEDTMPHAWITLFAPAEKPEIIITVLSESSGEGSNIAAPIAKKILEEWFGKNKLKF